MRSIDLVRARHPVSSVDESNVMEAFRSHAQFAVTMHANAYSGNGRGARQGRGNVVAPSI
jgi:hypothetical protein